MTTDHQPPLPDKPTTRKRRFQPYKRRPTPDPFLAIPNARTREGKALRVRRATLIAHCGTAPSATQAILIDRIINLEWQSMQLDRLAARASGAETIDMLERADKLANTLGRCLARLGLEAAAARKLTPEEALAAIRLMHAPRQTETDDAA
ncbi:MAG TPA: hypothetical protein VHB27_04635 [Rhodopila sp.]|uniref:hypothetical protein n=1 Tax=Rhodopila sp. TaxID=2480087 RepID=UPI002C445B16|nr:hypothetical protein [Rhodopila sp.]HVY14490.1 hypothetical protein [Rhodopila sp.]